MQKIISDCAASARRVVNPAYVRSLNCRREYVADTACGCDIESDIMHFKPLVWMGDSLERVRSFTPTARHRTGFELWEVQQGNAPSDWKPMSTVGAGVQELRVRAERAYRVLYVATFPEAVYVLHAFEKRSRQTPESDKDLARTRYRNLIRERDRR